MNRVIAIALLSGALLLAGCASAPTGAAKPDAAAEAVDPRDPFEPFNRKVYAFNDAVDTAVVKPAAQLYRAVVPELVRTGIDNVFGNLGDVWSAVNLVLQAKPQKALETGMRFGTNTVFGLLGLVDVASELGLQRQTEDFGQTLGVWGVGSGPYLMLPLLGPSTVRDASALVLDFKASPSNLVLSEARDRNGASVLGLLNTRSNLLDAGRVLDDIALDKYTFLRDAFLARRRNQVYDGDPPDDGK